MHIDTYLLPCSLSSTWTFKMKRKNASKRKSVGLSRLEKVVVPAKATTIYRRPVTRSQLLRSSNIQVEPRKISLLKNRVADY